MAKIYAHRTHNFTDRATRQNFYFPEKGWIEVPDPIAIAVLGAHPDKLLDISNADDPDSVAQMLGQEPESDLIEEEVVLVTAPPKPRKKRRPRTTPAGTRGRGSL